MVDCCANRLGTEKVNRVEVGKIDTSGEERKMVRVIIIQTNK